MFRKKETYRVTGEDVIALKDEYFLDHYPSKLRCELQHGNTERWNLAGPEIENEICRDFFRCTVELMDALAQGHSAVTVITSLDWMKEKEREYAKVSLSKRLFGDPYRVKLPTLVPDTEFEKRLAELYDQFQKHGRLLPCIYGKSVALLSDHIPKEVFAKFFGDIYGWFAEEHNIRIYKAPFEELNGRSGHEVLEYANYMKPMLDMAITFYPTLDFEYDPEQITFNAIAETAKKVMNRMGKKLGIDVFEDYGIIISRDRADSHET